MVSVFNTYIFKAFSLQTFIIGRQFLRWDGREIMTCVFGICTTKMVIIIIFYIH